MHIGYALLTTDIIGCFHLFTNKNRSLKVWHCAYRYTLTQREKSANLYFHDISS